MTEIEKKALALVNEVQVEEGYTLPSLRFKRSNDPFSEALCRAIEAHEAFRKEVSDAVEEIAKVWGTADPAWGYLRRFIIPKPDPLVEVCREIGLAPYRPDELRAAIKKRGGKIVWEGK